MNSHLTCLTQSVEHRTGIAEVMGSNPVGASEFFLGFLCNCLSYFTTAKISFTSILCIMLKSREKCAGEKLGTRRRSHLKAAVLNHAHTLITSFVLLFASQENATGVLAQAQASLDEVTDGINTVARVTNMTKEAREIGDEVKAMKMPVTLEEIENLVMQINGTQVNETLINMTYEGAAEGLKQAREVEALSQRARYKLVFFGFVYFCVNIVTLLSSVTIHHASPTFQITHTPLFNSGISKDNAINTVDLRQIWRLLMGIS